MEHSRSNVHWPVLGQGQLALSAGHIRPLQRLRWGEFAAVPKGALGWGCQTQRYVPQTPKPKPQGRLQNKIEKYADGLTIRVHARRDARGVRIKMSRHFSPRLYQPGTPQSAGMPSPLWPA